jgi:hypothetical protein
MLGWWVDTFGDPCRSCGFDWSIAADKATVNVAHSPERYTALLGGLDGRQRHPDLSWSVKAYVFHVADNLRIWAERLAAASAGSVGPIAPYDDNLLAQARAYEQMPIEAALWSLRQSVECWKECVHAAGAAAVVLNHPERGWLTVLEVVRSNCHDVVHHEWDIQRSISRIGGFCAETGSS